MAERTDEADRELWNFDTVQDFWEYRGSLRFPASVRRGSFVGQVQKGIVENGNLRELRSEDIASGTQPDTLIVVQVQNDERLWNWNKLQHPPPRTGMFSAFMDEVEEVAIGAGCRHVWVESVANEFLPEKLEARGYTRLDDPDGFPNPDYAKSLL